MEFHIHIDATTLPIELERAFKHEFGFKRTDFVGHPVGHRGYEPPNHLTLKLHSKQAFRTVFKDVILTAQAAAGFCGYIEGELLTLDEAVKSVQYDPSVKPPFKLELASLPPDSFRQTELHVTMDTSSDERLLQQLTRIGLFSAYMKKPQGLTQVFTAQGTIKEVGALIHPILMYLIQAGGVNNCTVKEERVVGWWVSQPGIQLPPVVKGVKWARLFS